MRDMELAVELLETRHLRNAFKAMPVKTDRKDAPGIAQLMRLGWFRPDALQVAAGAGSASAAVDEEPRCRDEPATSAAWLRAESRPNDTAKFPWSAANWSPMRPYRTGGAAGVHTSAAV
jgi:hypothetical protein